MKLLIICNWCGKPVYAFYFNCISMPDEQTLFPYFKKYMDSQFISADEQSLMSGFTFSAFDATQLKTFPE